MTRLLVGLCLFGLACTSAHGGGGADETDDDDGAKSCSDPSAAHESAAQADFDLRAEYDREPSFQAGSVSTNFEGVMTVTSSLAPGLELTADDGTRAAFTGTGALADVAEGTTLWASLHQTSSRPNPYAYREDRSNSIRSAAGGPVLAESQLVDLPVGTPRTGQFLGVATTFQLACATIDECVMYRRYTLTIHGDEDVTLNPGTHAAVAIGGIEYTVWLTQAQSVAYNMASTLCAPADWAPTAHVILAGRAVDLRALLDDSADAGAVATMAPANDASASAANVRACSPTLSEIEYFDPDASDFSIELAYADVSWQEPTQIVNYEGTVTISDVSADALQLEGSDGTSVSFGGVRPELAAGATLWGSLHQTYSRPNPYAFYGLKHNVLKVSEHGPVLAEQQVAEVLDAPSSEVPFLGVSATVAEDCLDETSCYRNRRFTVTVHGDEDLTLAENGHGRVAIDGIAYEVRLGFARIFAYVDQSYMCIPADWAPDPGLRLAGRAVDYAAVLDK